MRFENGDIIQIKSGGQAKVISKLGEGGQGVVYKVLYNEKYYALKWYSAQKLKDPSASYRNIENNIQIGAPSDAFLWPQHLTEQCFGSFGYLMDLCPSGYRDFGDLLMAKTHYASIQAGINTALNFAKAMSALHEKGLCFGDLNDGNISVNPQNGDILICDNDNVAPFGAKFAVPGKCRYVAPEIVTHKQMPDIHTDEFSMAVVLFMMLFLNHPLEGSASMSDCMTEEFEQKLYGTEPVFIFDDSGTNKPVQGTHNNAIKFWPCYPKFIQDAFKEAFSQENMTGESREKRITAKQWCEILSKLQDSSLQKCPCCGNEFFSVAACTDMQNLVEDPQCGFYDQCIKLAKHTKVVFFVVGASKSMEGAKIGALNQAMSEFCAELAKISADSPDAEIKIAVLRFGDGAEWITEVPVAAENFSWNDLVAEGQHDFGEAYNKLAEKLSRNAFMKEASGSYAPVIFLISDGCPTDDYSQGLSKLKENKWFQHAIRVALAIGYDADNDVLKEFTGTSETVLTFCNMELLRKLIRISIIDPYTAAQTGDTIHVPEDIKIPSKMEEFAAALEAEGDVNIADDFEFDDAECDVNIADDFDGFEDFD